eukprot:Hpha_TRINITY_DN16042_c0_g5::TRINITY_DN16042_c0_g5_i1::g.118330::m.118330/K00823/puuE; 4-aminobutyrate aminotransferase
MVTPRSVARACGLKAAGRQASLSASAVADARPASRRARRAREGADPAAAVLLKRAVERSAREEEIVGRPRTQEGKLCGVWKCSTDITVARAKGCEVWATDGRGPFLDLTGGIAVVNTGHCHPKVTAAIQEQAELVLHAQVNNYHHPGLHELARRLGAYLPPGLDTIYYDNTGTQAIEAAIKLARLHNQRPYLLTLQGGMHGRSTMCSAMTSNHSIRNPMHTPLPSGVYTAAFPSAFRWGVSEEEATERALNSMKDLLKGQVRPEQVAAIVMEPVLGEGGFYPLPTEYVRGLREVLEPHGILYISDEIQAGFGRTGKMWGCDHFSEVWRPDIIAASKGIASGMPLSMVASTDAIMQSFTPGAHGGTFNGNAVAVAAALATLDVFEEEGVIENSRKQGALFKELLQGAWERYQPQGEVRGPGLMLAVECIDKNGRPDPQCAQFIKEHCREHAQVLIYSATGYENNILRLMPPLVIAEHETVRAAAAIEAALKEWTQRASHA